MNLLILVFLIAGGRAWNETYRSVQSCSGDCVVPSGETWIIDQSIDVNTITVHGTLKWDINKPDLTIRTNGLLVEEGGLFQVGTESEPMLQKATIYIKDPISGDVANHPSVGQRYFVTFGKGKIEMHGRPLERTWSELDRNHAAGDTTLHLKDDPIAMGWQVGDRVGVATTTRGDSTVHTITSIQQNVLNIDTPLTTEHWGGFREIQGYRFWMAAEVVNLDRNILVTGDSQRFDNGGGFGWHGGAFMKAPHYTGEIGVFTTKYVRMEKCGQLDVLGRYCVHMHVNRNCPECVIQGNTFVESYQSAITLHGVHHTLVDNNVGWDNRGVGLYTEDGNEIGNVISNNVFICHDIFYCRIEWQNTLGVAPAQKEGGIFMFGMSNDVIGNHVVGHEQGLWAQGAAQNDGRPFGFDMGMVCNQFTPFGKIQRNVFHDCQRFGMYVDFQFPRNVVQDENGLISKIPYAYKPSCDEFTPEGDDNGVSMPNLIEDQFDWHNTFTGGYFFGDISWVRYTSVNNAHALYWKFSKNFANPDGYHLKDSMIVNDPDDHVAGQLWMLLPGGSFAFKMKNVTFAGGPSVYGAGVINAPQHCGLREHNNGNPGAKCNVEILMEDVDFSGVLTTIDERVLTKFGSSGGNPVSPIYIAKDDSLGGHRTVVSNFLNGFANVPGCQGPDPTYSGYVCDDSVKIRRMTIWAPDLGQLKLQGPGYEVSPDFSDPTMGANGGILAYDIDQAYYPSISVMQGGGYAANVVIGGTYTLEMLSWKGDIVVEVSDPILAKEFKTDPQQEGITLNIKLSDGKSFTCYPNAGESRKFHGSGHIDKRALRAGSMGECSEMFREATGHGLQPTIPTVAPSGDCGCPGAEYDPTCKLGGAGCSACGIEFCRFCGSAEQPCRYTTSGIEKTTTPNSNPTNNPTNGPTQPPTPPPGCDCDGAAYDNRCSDPANDPYGGLGCMACGKENCRFCGHDNLPDCEGGGTSSGPGPQTTSSYQPTANPGCDCDKAGYDSRCSDPSNDPFGGLGCMACGKDNCRFCGFDNMPPCQ